jgi:glycosyltransferase involved in cell wall biosynthesis
MRPALLPSSYPPNLGGVERVAEELASGLVRRGHVPVVYTNRWPKSLREEEDGDGARVLRRPFAVPHPSIRGVAGWLARSIPTRRELVRDARAHGCDLVNLHCVSSNAEYALAIAGALDVPLVVSVHGELSGDANDGFARDARLRRVWRQLIDAADLVTAPSAFTLAEAEAAYGSALGERGRVVRNGVDVELFAGDRRESADEPMVFALGRLVANKGFDLLLDAWDRLPATSSARLVIAGDGPAKAALRSRAAAARRPGSIRLAGSLDRAQVAATMRAATVFVLPSRAEALGLTVLEAMAAGTPVIASKVGGVPELVRDGETGALFADGDVTHLAQLLETRLADPGAGRAQAEQARSVASSLTWERCIDEFVDCYSSVLDARSLPDPRDHRVRGRE